MNKMNFPGVFLTAVVFLTGCVSPPPNNAELDAARMAYDKASQNHLAARLAPAELERARDTLEHAQQRWAERGDTAEISHLAYLASQQVAIAEQLAAGREAEERIAHASQQRGQLIAEARALAAEQRVASLQQALDAALSSKSRKTERGLVITLSSVLFDFAGTALRPGGAATVAKLAGVLRQYPEYRVLIEGHTDSIGSDRRNQQLSERRAETVRRALLQQQIDPGRIQARGLGERKPIADNRSRAGRQLNRRVEALIFKGKPALLAD